MTRSIRTTLMLVAAVALLSSCCCKDGSNLAGDWTLSISNYQNSCGGEPTVSRTIHLTQDDKDLTATIEVQGDDGKMYTGTFKGTVDKLPPPASASLHGNFEVGSFVTDETIEITFQDEKTFSGSSKWTTDSKDGKIHCVGTQNVSGARQ